jgi:repressor LexA
MEMEEMPAAPAGMGLSEKQRACLDAINSHEARTGAMPSCEDLRLALGLGSKNGVLRLLRQLEDRGRITRLPQRARAIRVLPGETCPQCAARRERRNAGQ